MKTRRVTPGDLSLPSRERAEETSRSEEKDNGFSSSLGKIK